MAIVDALRLILWRWRPLLATHGGLAESLGKVVMTSSRGVLESDEGEGEAGHEGYPWSVADPGIRPGGEGEGVAGTKEASRERAVGMVSSQLAVPLYVLQNLWDCLLALGHCLVTERNTTEASSSSSSSFEGAARVVVDSAREVAEVLRSQGVAVDLEPLEAVETQLREKEEEKKETPKLTGRRRKRRD